jgi:hypothetical protein
MGGVLVTWLLDRLGVATCWFAAQLVRGLFIGRCHYRISQSVHQVRTRNKAGYKLTVCYQDLPMKV